MEAWATERRLSPKHLRLLWDLLVTEPSNDKFVVGTVPDLGGTHSATHVERTGRLRSLELPWTWIWAMAQVEIPRPIQDCE